MYGVVSILWENEGCLWSEGKGLADELECRASVGSEDDG
jgi:hypothetical protein